MTVATTSERSGSTSKNQCPFVERSDPSVNSSVNSSVNLSNVIEEAQTNIKEMILNNPSPVTTASIMTFNS